MLNQESSVRNYVTTFHAGLIIYIIKSTMLAYFCNMFDYDEVIANFTNHAWCPENKIQNCQLLCFTHNIYNFSLLFYLPI